MISWKSKISPVLTVFVESLSMLFVFQKDFEVSMGPFQEKWQYDIKFKCEVKDFLVKSKNCLMLMYFIWFLGVYELWNCLAGMQPAVLSSVLFAKSLFCC